MTLAGRTAVVTGGSRGIGRAIALGLAREGVRVAICGRDPAGVRDAVAALRELVPDSAGRACDVTDPHQVREYASWVRGALGVPDILVNNAGVGRFGPLEDLSLDDWDTVFATNVRSLFLVTREFLPDMKRRGSGDVVTIASLAGRNGFPDGTAYAASKHAAVGFSRALLLEARPHGIRAIAVCPGSVDTGFFHRPNAPSPARERMLRPEDVAATVVAALRLPAHATLSELDVRPANPS